MLSLYLSTERKDNSDRILQMICRNAQAGIDGQFLIVPEQFSHMAECRLCLRGGDSISRYVEVLGFSRLAARVFAAEGGGAEEETDPVGKLLLMAAAAEQVRSRLKVFGGNASKPEYLLRLLDMLDEFRSFCVSPSVLRKASVELNGVLAEKTEEFALLMEAYAAVCAQMGQNPETRLNRLLSALELSGFGAGKRFYFDAFADFNGVELEIIAQLLTSGAEVCVALTCDGVNGGGQQYDTARHTATALLRIAQTQGIRTEVTVGQDGSTPFSRLRRELFGGARCEPIVEGSVRCFTAPSKESECRLAAGELLRLVQENGLRWRDITVACADWESYAPILRSVLRQAEIPSYFAGDRTMLGHPTARMLLNVLAAASGSMEQEPVLEYLKSGFTPLSEDRCDRLENYILLWNISGGGFAQPWQMHPDGLRQATDDKTARRLAELNEDRLTVIRPVCILSERLKTAKNTGQMVRALWDFTEEIGLYDSLNREIGRLREEGELQAAQEYAQILTALCGVLEQMYGVLGDSVRAPEDFYRMFRAALSVCRIGTIPATLDCVNVGALLSQRQCDTKVLFLLGANEGSFPASGESAGLLTDSERVDLLQLGVGVAPTAAERLNRELGVIDSVLAAPTQLLYLGAQEGNQAYLFRRAVKLCGRYAMEETELTSRCHGGYVAYLTEHPEAPCREPKLSEQAERLRQAGTYGFGTLAAETVTELYGQRIRLSSSKVDRLAGCRFAYYLEYGLRAKERKAAEMDAPLYGEFVHAVLEDTARQVQREGGFASVTEERTLEIAEESMERYVQRELSDLFRSERTAYLFRRTFSEVRQVVAELHRELSVSAFEPRWFELHFAADGDLPAVRIVGKHAVAELEGFVDRADVWQSGECTYVRIVDYKTGKKDFDYTMVLNGIGLQMLLYLFTLTEKTELLPAGVLYFPARMERLNRKDRADETAMQAERRKALRRKGLLLNDPAVLYAMEPNEERPRFLPVDYDKEGTPKGDLASMDEWKLLRRHVFSTLEALTDALCEGALTPDPYYRDSMHNACAWCPYGTVCRAVGNWRYLQKVKNAEEFWQRLEEKEHG